MSDDQAFVEWGFQIPLTSKDPMDKNLEAAHIIITALERYAESYACDPDVILRIVNIIHKVPSDARE